MSAGENREMKKNEIVLVETQDNEIKLEVPVEQETVWLSLNQMAELFDRDKSTISRHIRNALKEELSGEATVANFATVQSDSTLFGNEKDDSLKGSLGAIYQSFGGQDVYPMLEEKVANLLYFVVKNHSLSGR